MATLNQVSALRDNAHLRGRLEGALAKAANAVLQEKRDFTATIADDKINSTSHAFVADQEIEFLAGSTLPTGVTIGVRYFVRDVLTNDFKVANSKDGTAISLTGADGFGEMSVINHPSRYEWATKVLLKANGSTLEAKRVQMIVLQDSTIQDGYNSNPVTGGSITDVNVENSVNSRIDHFANTIELA